jgi:hypothetical protein
LTISKLKRWSIDYYIDTTQPPNEERAESQGDGTLGARTDFDGGRMVASQHRRGART